MNFKKLTYLLMSCTIMAACGNNTEESTTTQTEKTVKDTIKVEKAPKAKVQTGPVLGIDVSHFQGNIKWDEIKSAGVHFAYDKATQGMTYVDPEFKENQKNARAAGLHHGAYHFYVAGDDPDKQARNFLNALQRDGDGHLIPVLDLEQGGMKAGIAKDTYQKNVKIWLAAVEKELGVKPIIYTNHPFGNEYLTDPSFADHHLWIAEYGVSEPKIPNTWKDKGWLIWQRSEKGKVEGAVGNVDHDIYNDQHGDFETVLLVKN